MYISLTGSTSVSWQKQVTRSKIITSVDIREKPPNDPNLACPIDNKLFMDAVKTPCCGTLFCEECIHSHLLENDFVCPNCSKRIPSLDKLMIDKPMRTKVGDYIDRQIKERQAIEDAAAAAAAAADSQGSVSQEKVGLHLLFEIYLIISQQDGSPEVKEDEEFTLDQQQPTVLPDFDVTVLLNETIPQLQAQIQQLSVMMQNPSLPHQVRQSTEFQYQQLQMQLTQAQAFAAFTADINAVAAAAAAAAAQQQQTQQQQQQQQQKKKKKMENSN